MKQMDTRTVMAAPAANDAAGTERFSALGIPVDNLNMATACERVLDLVYRYPRTRRAAYVATVNVDFMVNALAVAGHAPRHPELLDILRSADLVTADGFPIVLLSRMLGTPLQGRVTGADLVPALAERAAKEGLRIYLLGGREEIARRAADMLEEANPGLEIAGVESPMVHTEGQALVNFEKDDERIIADINRSGADILLLGLGNPKQEQWFRRHRDKLKVPVSIGVGGTFEFIVGTVQRAPGWVQRANLEWLYRITQDPARLWKRYAEGLLKLALLVVPLLWLRCKELALTEVAWRGKSEPVPGWRQFSGPHRSRAASATFSPLLREAQLRRLLSEIECAPRDDTLYLMDFSQVRRVELNAMQAV
jgi:exopolysaccharide biosynthesis WecB/TagA/CpsF family protein